MLMRKTGRCCRRGERWRGCGGRCYNEEDGGEKRRNGREKAREVKGEMDKQEGREYERRRAEWGKEGEKEGRVARG